MLQKMLALIIFLCVVSGHRVRRHLVFTKGSRLFFSVDVRDNLFNYSDYFAQVIGFKIDWDLPTGIVDDSNKGGIQRRDLYQGIEQLLNHQKLNGTLCIKKFLCEASHILPASNQFLAQLYEIIFNTNDGFKSSDRGECIKMLTTGECPLSLTSVFRGRQFDFNISFLQDKFEIIRPVISSKYRNGVIPAVSCKLTRASKIH